MTSPVPISAAFGDLEHEWCAHRVRRGGDWVDLPEDACDLLFALLRADGFAASGERLWHAMHGSTRRFDGDEMLAVIGQLNACLAPLDCEVEIRAFTARLIDITPQVLPLRGRTG